MSGQKFKECILASKPFTLKNKGHYISLEASGGVYHSVQLELLATWLKEKGAVAKITEDQRLCVVIHEKEREKLAAFFGESGIQLRDYQNAQPQPVSCLGGLCPFSEQDALQAALTIGDKLEVKKSTTPVRVGINGCIKSCVPAHTLDLCVTGFDQGFQINSIGLEIFG